VGLTITDDPGACLGAWQLQLRPSAYCVCLNCFELITACARGWLAPYTAAIWVVNSLQLLKLDIDRYHVTLHCGKLPCQASTQVVFVVLLSNTTVWL
jgi:hypothetical protein